MKNASPAMVALLEQSGARDFWSARCVEIATKVGLVLRYTEADVSLKLPEVPGVIFRHDGARVTFGGVKETLGPEVDDTTLDLAPIDTDGGTDPGISVPPQFSNLPPLMVMAQNGLFDRAAIAIWRALAPLPGPTVSDLVPDDPNAGPVDRILTYTPTGAIERFYGEVGPVRSPTETRLVLTIKSALNVLNANFPRYVYRPGCVWDLYGQGCGINRGNFEFLGIAFAPASTRTMVVGEPQSTGPQFSQRPEGYFDEGVIRFLSGANAFVRRTVREHRGNVFHLALPLPYPIVGHEEFVLTPGCDKTFGTCGSRFGNQARFRGFPHVPPPDSMTGTKMKDVTEERLRLPAPVEE